MPGVRVGLLVLVLGSMLAVAGCGGGGDDTVEGWAGNVCGNLSEWIDDVDEAVASLTDDGLALDEGDLRAAADDVEAATDELAQDLRELERPEEGDVERAAQELEELASALEAEVERIEAALEGDAPPLEIVAAVTTALSAAAEAARDTYETIEELDPAGELAAAFRDSDECQSLRDRVAEIGSGSE